MDFFNAVKEFFQELGNKIIEVLPTSPIVYLQSDSTINKYISYVNWFIPVYAIISMLEAWLVCVAIYYIIQVVLRWIKVVE